MERLKIAAIKGVQLLSNEHPRRAGFVWHSWHRPPALWAQHPSTCWGQESWCASAQFVTIPTAGAQFSCKTSIPQASHRSVPGKKQPTASFSIGMISTAPSAGNTDLEPWGRICPSGSAWSPGKGRFTATELKQQLLEDKSNFQGTGLANHPSVHIPMVSLAEADQDKGPGFTQNPATQQFGGLQQEKCAAALPGSVRFTQWGKKKAAQDKKSYSSVTQMSSYPKVNNLKVIY